MDRSPLRVFINGLGRIGRLIFRRGFDSLNIVAVNGTSPPDDLVHYLKYDSIHGVWKRPISAEGQELAVDGRKTACWRERSPDLINWSQIKADVVIECSGKFKKSSDWKKAFAQGVKQVIVSAPAEDPDFTLVFGVNQNVYNKDKHKFISSASCTTNCLAPVIKALKDSFGVERGFFSAIHSYTNDQRLLDSSHKKDLRRARAASLNIIPTSTGAGSALSLIFPELKGRIRGQAFRVPTANVSLLDLTVETQNSASLNTLRSALQQASLKELKGILAIEEKPLVSSDFIGRSESSIVDFPLTALQGQKLLKLVCWYDNEAGFSERIIDFIHFITPSR